LRATRGYSPARQLGIAEIPVMVAAGWSEAQKRAYVLADNQLAITGSGWDPELLRLELGEPRRSGRFARRSDATERWSIDRLIPYAKKRTDPHGGAGRPSSAYSRSSRWHRGAPRRLAGIVGKVDRIVGPRRLDRSMRAGADTAMRIRSSSFRPGSKLGGLILRYWSTQPNTCEHVWRSRCRLRQSDGAGAVRSDH
jgi:hypothetical protein